jgi:hypothetical protein
MALPLVLGGALLSLLANRGQQRPSEAIKETVGEPPDIQGELGPRRDELVRATETQVEAEKRGAEADQARADFLAERVGQQGAVLSGNIEQVRGGLAERDAELQEGIESQRDQLGALPGNVREEFEGLRSDFREQVSSSLGRMGGFRQEALADVYKGQSLAMDSAVQGIQGNINTQMSQIRGNPNLSEAQKQQMMSQVKLGGAMAMGPAIGATQLQFNQLAADTATKFGSIIGSVETAGITGEAGLAGAQGQAFTQASIAAGQLGNQLLDIEKSANEGYAAAQSQLLGLRSQAENTGNRMLLDLLPHRETPVMNYVAPAQVDLQSMKELLQLDFSNRLGVGALEVQGMAADALAGNPFMNALQFGLAFSG